MAATPKVAAVKPATRIRPCRVMTGPPSARIGDDVDNRRLAAFDGGDRALERGSKILRIDDRTLAGGAHAARHHRVVDVGVLDRGANVSLVDAAAVTRCHRL